MAETCLIWKLAMQLIQEESVLHSEMQRKKERIQKTLAVAAAFASNTPSLATVGAADGGPSNRWRHAAAAAGGSKKASAASILASIGL